MFSTEDALCGTDTLVVPRGWLSVQHSAEERKARGGVCLSGLA